MAPTWNGFRPKLSEPSILERLAKETVAAVALVPLSVGATSGTTWLYCCSSCSSDAAGALDGVARHAITRGAAGRGAELETVRWQLILWEISILVL